MSPGRARDGRRSSDGAAPPVAVAAPSVAVAAEHLRRSFGEKAAVSDVSLSIPSGAFFGLVGPNGAGKSTTLKMVAGLLRPHGGRVEVWGRDVWADPVAAKAGIGVLTEDLRLFDRLSGAELLVYNGLLRRIERSVIEDRSAELLAVLGLQSAARTLVVDYSQGMKKKIALACALLHAPRVLLLDEPFESVDPVSTRGIRSVLDQFCEGGGTVVFSSHVMETVELLCDHVAIMHSGKIAAAGRMDEVRGGRRLEDAFFERVGARSDAPGGLRWLGSSSA